MSDIFEFDGHGAVLREVTLTARPHVLRRPAAQGRADGAGGGAGAARAPDAVVGAAPATPVAPDAREQYRLGHAQGVIDGRLAEREAAAAAATDAGYQQGLRQGLLQGRADAEKAARAEVAQRVAALDTLLRALPAQLDARLDDAEDDQIALCYEVVCRVAGADAATPEGLGRLVRQAATRLRAQRALTLQLHPQDVAMLRDDPDGAAWLRDDAWPDGIELVADNRVAVGGAIVRGRHGSLDARLETQFGLLKDMLLRQRCNADGAGVDA
ncbi:FliH/SctL family protein [Oxalobacteraceae bacterium OTU3REALA1]|nr:FliH/SctL family protein [Oxalobacteraceae bacterium OTU3REALA1]